jgi:glycosyltransferase involved in cell wall biosynthesis
MKICVIGLRGLPDVPGGIETHCENLYHRLSRLDPGIEFVVYGRKAYVGTTPYTTSTGVRVVPAPAFRNKYLETISNTMFAILNARFIEHADYVHIHAIGPGLLSFLARLLGMKVILTHHGDDFRRAKWNRFSQAVLRLGERIGVSNASRTIAVSPSLADRLRQTYPSRADSISYIPNGADHIVSRALAADGTKALETLGLTPNGYIIAVGRLVPEKGFADLIRAHKASGMALPLVIVGGASHSDHEAELARMAHDGVILTGSLPQAKVAHLLAQARLFVMPSHHEGLPIAALEAWAMSAPLLLSDIQPNRDLHLPEAHYFPVGDVDALAKRLREDTRDMPALSLPPMFNWTSIAGETAAIYNAMHDSKTTKRSAA